MLIKGMFVNVFWELLLLFFFIKKEVYKWKQFLFLYFFVIC